MEGEVRTQCLLALSLGAKAWSEWEGAHAPDGLPKIIGGAEFMAVPKPEPQVQYRRGSYGDRYGAMFEKMPPLANHIGAELSDVVRHIHEMIVAAGEPCTLERAKTVFDGLRNKKVGVLVFDMPC